MIITKKVATVNKVLISGSSGFIGKNLSTFLRTRSYNVVSLVRGSISQHNAIAWDPEKGHVPIEELEGFDAIIHLAGKNIASRRWTHAVKEELFLSRTRDTWLLAHSLLRLKNPPKCLIVASATGYYGNRPGEERLTEEAPAGSGFLADLCQRWEEAAQCVTKAGVRLVQTRFGIVLSQEGGMLKRLLPVYRAGLGATLGSGKQFYPWVSLEDLIRALHFALENHSLTGPVNVVAPERITQEQFSRKLAESLHRPHFMKLPAPLLRLVLGQMADEMLLASTPAYPEKLLAQGFSFETPTLNAELRTQNAKLKRV